MKDGKEIGYTITFSKGNPITIYHGKDGQDGEDGITPTISVKKDTDGVYYWTLNGEFIVVDGGKSKPRAKTEPTARPRNSKSKTIIGLFPIITEQIGRS